MRNPDTIDVVEERSVLKHTVFLLSRLFANSGSEHVSKASAKASQLILTLKHFNEQLEHSIPYVPMSEHLYVTLCDSLDEYVADQGKADDFERSFDYGDTRMDWPEGHERGDLPHHTVLMHAFAVGFIPGSIADNLREYAEEGDEPAELILERIPQLVSMNGHAAMTQSACALLLSLVTDDDLRCRALGLPRPNKAG